MSRFDFTSETEAKKRVDALTQERSKMDGYAAITSQLLGTLGNDLSGGPKFAYELLQNAHDTGSAEKPVNTYLYYRDNYLIWAHDGLRLFDSGDLE